MINGNHWLALIIDIKQKKFLLLDPQQLTFDFGTQYEFWPNYYNQRKDADLAISWHQDHIFKHPIQTDYFKSDVFTINFIEQYVFSGKIDFPTDPKSLFSCRQKVMNKIKDYFS